MVQRLIQRADYINARLRRLQRQDPTTNDDACERETNNGSMQIESTDNKGTIDRPREGRESEKKKEEIFFFAIIKKGREFNQSDCRIQII